MNRATPTVQWPCPAIRFGSWYNLSWTNRKPVTVDHTKVTGGAALTNYPMLFSVTDTDLAAAAQSSGNDILFTAADGVTKLNHEIESYNSSTGQLIAWVEVPTLSASADTGIYIYYGNSTASNQQNAAGVWDSNYQGVYHLGNGSTLSGNDSTGNANNPTATTATAASGKIGGGASFNGAERITLPNIALSSGMTLEAWFNPASLGAGDTIVCKTYSGLGPPYVSYCLSLANASGSTLSLNALMSSGGTLYYTTSNTAVGTNAWHHLVGTYDGSHLNLYLDGAVNATPVAVSGSIG